MVNCGRLIHILCMINVRYTMVCLFQNTMVFYHSLPVSKYHGIDYGIRWYIFTRATLYNRHINALENAQGRPTKQELRT